MENIYSVRESSPDDKETVLQIHGNVYDGLDYLPEYYDYFQKSHHVTSYVYLENDKIIAYLACCNINNGETMVTRAGRVHPEYQGRHLYGRFVSEIETIQKADGKTKRHTLLKSTSPSDSFLSTYKLVATKEINMFEYTRSSISRKVTELASEICSLSKILKNIPEEFLQPPYSNYLFPEGRILVDWVPFRLLSTNVRLLKGIDTVFYSDITAVGAEVVEDLNEHQKGDTERVQGLLSASSVFELHKDLDITCNLDVFGTDFRSIYDHILFHLQRISDFCMERVNLRIYITQGTSDNLLRSTLEQIGIKSIAKESRKEVYVGQFVYEKEISK